MADSELSGIAADTTPDLTDIVYATDAAGTVDKKVAFGDFPFATLGYGFDLVTRSGFADADTVDIQEFTGSGTWTKPDGARVVHAILIGAGGGGASGYRGAEGTDRYGGGGGAPGEMKRVWIPASDLDATEAVTVGTAGTGGAANTTGTNPAGVGNDGVAGGNTILDTIAGDITATGGSPGIHVGGLLPGLGGYSGGGRGGSASVSTTLPVVLRGAAYLHGVMGGGGAGLSRSASNFDSNYGNGGGTPGSSGSTTGVAGTDGNMGSGGGGGGAAATAGLVGGTPGGGGGGGGYGNSGTPNNSGAGGNGGAGYALIITFL